MGFFEVATSTPAVRDFSDRPLDDRTIERILETANMAPSGSNAQPWEFIVIRESAIKTQLRELYVDLWEAHKASRIVRERSTLSLRARKALQAGDQFAAALERVPVHVVVVLNRTRMRIERGSDKDRVYPSSVYGSVFPAIELMMLSARALGIGTAVTTMLSPCEERVKQLLKIPEPHQVIALVPMGYPLHSFKRPFRQPVWSRIRKEDWETPWTPTTRQTTHER
jgi:nitroreductase